MKLAIKGHSTRGKEVINLLEMLGADRLGYKDTFVGFYYYIECDAIVSTDEYPTDTIVFTLEKFLEKFPYKVGDKVYNIIHNENQTITNLDWDFQENEVCYQTNNNEYVYVNYLQPYKEETMEKNINEKTFPPYMDYDITTTYGEMEKTKIMIPEFPQSINLVQSNVKEIEVVLGDYEFVLKEGKTYFVKKKPNYPKTYEECCNILGIEDRENGYCGYEWELLGAFQKLYICRDAYWKIAGKEMGLDKPWKPDWVDGNSIKYVIGKNSSGVIFHKGEFRYDDKILAFPIAEMRDAFYENFTDLIEQCKEFL